MKQIVPFRKEMPFDTKIGEVTSISLEHTLKFDENNCISGEFIISGEYKVTDISINRESFSYNLPFDITLDNKYKVDNAKLDIDDFYYEIVNDNSLLVNIDVLIDGIEVINEFSFERKLESEGEAMKEDVEKVLEGDNQKMENNELDEREVIDLFKEIETPPIAVSVEDNININPFNDKSSINLASEEKIKSLFDSFDENSETFTTYHVHIVRENDTIDTIVNKYKTTKEEIAAYNKIDELKLGDKIVIPASHNE